MNNRENLDALINDDYDSVENGPPLLIIDVNLSDSIKKQIFVYDGDSPFSLANKFAFENSK